MSTTRLSRRLYSSGNVVFIKLSLRQVHVSHYSCWFFWTPEFFQIWRHFQEGSRFRLLWREYPRDAAARRRARLNTNVIPVAVNATAKYVTNPGYPGYENNLRMVWDLQSPPMTRIQVRIVT